MKVLFLMLLSVGGASAATEYGKICIGPIAEADSYQALVNDSKQYVLSELVQICLNDISSTNTSIVKIFHENIIIQELVVNFIPGKIELVCISHDNRNKKWVANAGDMDEEHCEF